MAYYPIISADKAGFVINGASFAVTDTTYAKAYCSQCPHATALWKPEGTSYYIRVNGGTSYEMYESLGWGSYLVDVIGTPSCFICCDCDCVNPPEDNCDYFDVGSDYEWIVAPPGADYYYEMTCSSGTGSPCNNPGGGPHCSDAYDAGGCNQLGTYCGCADPPSPAWDSGTNYLTNDICTKCGRVYKALVDNTNVTPCEPANPDTWESQPDDWHCDACSGPAGAACSADILTNETSDTILMWFNGGSCQDISHLYAVEDPYKDALCWDSGTNTYLVAGDLMVGTYTHSGDVHEVYVAASS